MTITPIADLIRAKLITAFSPKLLDIKDESQLHRGHAGHHEAGESHFRIHIKAKAFDGRSRLERHRMVNEALREELRERVHALALRVEGENDYNNL